jgi:hypothetical protein
LPKYLKKKQTATHKSNEKMVSNEVDGHKGHPELVGRAENLDDHFGPPLLGHYLEHGHQGLRERPELVQLWDEAEELERDGRGDHGHDRDEHDQRPQLLARTENLWQKIVEYGNKRNGRKLFDKKENKIIFMKK